MRRAESRLVVFAGPSLATLGARERALLDLRPPARRGDLEALLGEEKTGTVLIVDGLFGGSLAVTPTECRHVLEVGWRVCGAASMGALRAAELWPLGMIGLGDVYTALRLSKIRDDDEVAVAYHPDTFEELTASLVHVRRVLACAAQRSGRPIEEPRAAFALAREVYWMERAWRRLGDVWRRAGISESLVGAALELSTRAEHHPKVQDGVAAVRSLVVDGGLGGTEATW